MANLQVAMIDAHDLRAGSVLQGRYKIVSALGAGGFGAVYKAVQLATNQLVAIKVMHPSSGEPEARRENRLARFRREMDLCARLQHPNIVGLVDSGQTDDGRLFAAFQLASGQTLDQVLVEEGPLSHRETRHLMLQVLDALSCAHNLGVVHRDLKPANIMIVSTGTRRNALVLDFGIGAMAKDANEAGYAKLTGQHEWLGTAHYAAPEQIRGYPPTPQSDIYGWGLVYLECLSGQPVISGTPMMALMTHIGPDPIPIPRSLRHHRLGRLLQRAVIKEVNERTATAAALLRELDDCDVSELDRLGGMSASGATVAGRRPADDSSPTYSLVTPEWGPRLSGLRGAPARPASERTTGRLVDGERRQVTAVCCSLVPGAGIELEELDALIQQQQEICAEVAERFHGQIAGGLGHQVLIEFGYPTAGEDDAIRAARAALAIRAAVVELDARRMAVRIGIHTGLIAYGPSETERRISSQIIGLTPMIASQLSATAARDSIVASAATARALRTSIVMTPIGSHIIDGVGLGVELFQIEAERATARSTGRGEPVQPLVGREREVALLLERWGQVAGGAGQRVLITGEAGIGKSRLALELSRRIGAHVHTWLEAHCTVEAQNRVLHPIIEVLEHVLGLGEVAPDARLDRIEAALIGFGFRPGDVVPLVAMLLSVPVGDRYPTVELSPARRRELTLDVIVSLLIELSERSPVVLFVEDLHWADPTTLDLLGALIAAVPSSRILALFSARPEFAPPWPTSATDQLQLSRLPHAQVEQIVGQVAAGKALPRGVLEQMVHRADGVPLFVEELTRMVIESGALTARGDRYELTGPLSEVAIPTTLRGSLMARLDRLGRAKETAQLAAALGREFELPLLTAVSTLNEAAVQEDLDKLVEADLVHHKRRLRNPTWLFRHALIRDTAYESMPRRVQHRVHARIADVLEQRFPEVALARPELLARHHAAADQKPRAIGYAQKAALAALMGSAYPHAIRHAREAIGWLEAIAEARARAEMELGFNGIIMPSLMSTRGWRDEELKAVIDRSQVLSDQLGDSPYTGTTLWALMLYFHMGGRDGERARTLADRLLAHARQIGDHSEEVMAAAAVGHTRWIAGEYEPASLHFDRVLAQYDPARHSGQAFLYGHDSKVWAGISYAEALWFMGRLDRSLKLAGDVLAWARELNHASSLAVAYIFFILLRHDRGERDAIDELWRPLLELSERHGLPVHVAYAGVVRCWSIGDVDGAKRHLALLESTGTELGLSFYRSVVAEAEAERGEHEAALARIEDCRRRAEELGERYYLAELLRLQGRFALAAAGAAAGDRAEALFRRAIEVAAGQGTKLSELRAASELARLLIQRGDLAGARALIAPRLAWFTEGLETAPLKEARGILAAL